MANLSNILGTAQSLVTTVAENAVRPLEMVAGGIVYVSEYKRSFMSLPVATVSVLIIYDKLVKRDNKSIWESLTMGWTLGEIVGGGIIAAMLAFFGPNPTKNAATQAIVGGS